MVISRIQSFNKDHDNITVSQVNHLWGYKKLSVIKRNEIIADTIWTSQNYPAIGPLSNILAETSGKESTPKSGKILKINEPIAVHGLKTKRVDFAASIHPYGCDNYRTSAVFTVPDICDIVGEITGHRPKCVQLGRVSSSPGCARANIS